MTTTRTRKKAPAKKATATKPVDRRTKEQLILELASREHDLHLIADAVLQECIERDWCEEYGHFVRNVNRRTHRASLQPCDDDLGDD